ncbi:hypothetical protein [Marinoscillum sp.]|uniref:hypothetical protein n=1 Tax=Marinoscillum sp. TaxID=2024838 RepID=UPI003BAC6A20
MKTTPLFSVGDPVVLKDEVSPLPMIVRKIYHNQFGKIRYQCSWQYHDDKIGNTSYDESDLELADAITATH